MILRNCNAEEFIKRLNGRKVICFGAGSTLIEAEYEVLKIDGLENHIDFFIDNDKNKHGLKYTYFEKKFEIKSVESLKTIKIEEYVLLITCAFYVEIYKQLKNIEEIKNLECYMYNVICSYPNLNVEKFFIQEIEKYAYKEWKKILSELSLKDRYKGQRCFIIGNGPSLRVEDLELLKNEITFATNRIFKLFSETTWRPTYYFCIDYLIYELDHEKIKDIEAKIRFVPIERALAAGKIYEEVTYYNRDVKYVDIKDQKIVRIKEFDFSEDVQEKVFGGQTVLFDVIQFAVYMGFQEIYLLGVDHFFKKEVLADGTIIETDAVMDHFNKEYEEKLDTAVAVVAPLYAAEIAFKTAKEVCDRKGIVIKNATRGGKLEVFERISLDDIFYNSNLIDNLGI